ncbi:hypothetical protein ACSBLW_00410 [Thioclava sp. FR2]|uniref:hypothetical protein n=1 Tax=Thioclava sp. FR2 TaxID=3445780 RepID=UPI003EBD29C7
MPRLSILFLGTSLATAFCLTLLQSQIATAGSGKDSQSNQVHRQAVGHGADHQAD